MNLDQVRALFSGENAARVKKMIDRLDEIDAELDKLGKERSELDAELSKILDITAPEPAPAADRRRGKRGPRHCKLCGGLGHIISRAKTADGRPTCQTYPNGKPLNAEPVAANE